jgi:hypothetical protein
MLVAKNSFVVTHFYSAEKLLVSNYSGRSNVELGLEHLSRVVEFYSKNEVRGSVVDISKIFGSFTKGINFMKEHYYPVAQKSGLTCQAFVIPNDVIVETLSNQLVKMASSFIEKVKLFTDRKEAEKWVKLNSAH